MNDLKIIEQHETIRETIGYDVIKTLDVCDIPEVVKFLKVVSNYNKIENLIKESE